MAIKTARHDDDALEESHAINVTPFIDVMLLPPQRAADQHGVRGQHEGQAACPAQRRGGVAAHSLRCSSPTRAILRYPAARRAFMVCINSP